MIPQFGGGLVSGICQEIILSANILTQNIPLSIRNLTSLTSLALADNLLTGTLSSELFAPLVNLQNIDLSKNKFSGEIPPTIQMLSVLSTVFLQDNSFIGDPSKILSSKQSFLQTIDISNNQFSGTISPAFFKLPLLNTLAAVKNCFHGTLPAEICHSETLSTLVFDGLSSSKACIRRIPYTKTYLTTNMEGTIPSCIFNMSQLRLLHLSGNGLEGPLAEEIRSDSKLTVLSLSHNQLTGTISRQLQTKKFAYLDLSYNRLSGYCDEMSVTEYHSNSSLDLDLDVTAKSSSVIYLKENRLSGNIPSTFRDAANIDVLAGNLFQCGDNIPQHDPSYSQYICGSEDLNSALYSWGVIVFILCVMCSIATSCSTKNIAKHVIYFNQCVNLTKEFINSQKSAQYVHVCDFINQLSDIQTYTFYSTLIIVFVYGPICVLLKQDVFASDLISSYGVYTYQYTWLYSGL
jgi:hypothetical protein